MATAMSCNIHVLKSNKCIVLILLPMYKSYCHEAGTEVYVFRVTDSNDVIYERIEPSQPTFWRPFWVYCNDSGVTI